MWRWLCLWVTLTASPALFADDLFQKGLAAYQNKQFEEARDHFQNLVSQGRTSPALFHNLALTYFQLDEKAYAMAFWRKALAVDPRFRPALAGRTFMESKFAMTPFERDSLSLGIRRTLESISIHEIAWLLALVLAITGWIWIRYIAARKTALELEQPKPPFPFTAAVLSLILLGVLSVFTVKMQFLGTVRATVVKANVAARSLPAEEGVSLFELRGGNEVLIRRDQDEWLQVQNSDGARGWVKKDEVLITNEGKKL